MAKNTEDLDLEDLAYFQTSRKYKKKHIQYSWINNDFFHKSCYKSLTTLFFD
jgi:hypothetical protein